ncbi:MAG: SDR family oxidoreductase [Acetobacteraceae bacterium]
MTIHLVTGGTGFVGGALILELLDRTDDPVIGLARPGGEDAHQRLIASLRHAALAYGRDPDTVPLGRVIGIPGDVTQPGCGVAVSDLRADMLWHSAASLRYEDRYAPQIRATNVDGVANVLTLARRTGVAVINAVSTAYVAGRQEGILAEVPQQHEAAQNHYERSKIEAEAMVRAARDFAVRILRPSIVVGHSATRAATTFSGLYGFARQMLAYHGILERMQKGLARNRRMKIRAGDDAPLDLIPVDAVAAQAVHIGLKPCSEGIYHLTQTHPPTVGQAIRAVARHAGFPEPEFVDADTPLEWLDDQFDKRLEFYSGYIRTRRVFDRSRADAALGNRLDLHRALPSVDSLLSWYMDLMQSQRRCLPASR